MSKGESRIYKQTRATFISVARDLFVEQGYQATTMNAIAKRSGKGRRTLYNYFGAKEEVYLAVIHEELQQLYEEVADFVYNGEMPPSQKLMSFIIKRMNSINEVVERNGSLDAEFFNDISAVERSRARFDILERQLIAKLLQDGINAGAFRRIDVKRSTLLLHACLKGLEVPYIRGQLGKNEEELLKTIRVVRSLILNGIVKQ
ncbi:MAG: TetR/AcrR family transcriptional regulator [Porphyromonas sp.]|nr:TetR/AcrR family transcriptional regulator [Porphyromonas sp.]